MTKAVALLSGGLDSTLAVKMMVDQGIEVHALNFTSAFCTCNSGGKKKHPAGGAAGCKSEAQRVAREFGVPIKVMVKGPEYMEIVRSPRHGYGKGVNPCVDCRIYMYRIAKKYMEEIGASFIITGEVLGQRPMSQRRDSMRVIERESGLEGLILRPLSAKHMEPTIPEKTGLVDREKLLSVYGRGRKPQMELAEELEVGDYPCPSGGCLLTDKIFSRKVRDLLDHNPEVTTRDLAILKVGRHFRFKGAKVVVARNETENDRLESLMQEGDLLVEPDGFPGPVAVVSHLNGNSGEVMGFAGSLVLRYSPKAEGSRRLVAKGGSGEEAFEVEGPAAEELVEGARVC